MDQHVPPPLPSRPNLDAPPRGSWLTIFLAGCGALAAAIVLSFLTMGFFVPFLALGAGIFVVIGLQYLVWGWLLERIYRSPEARQALAESLAAERDKDLEGTGPGSGLH